MTMPAGKYYVGDLCYVLHDEWDECCNLFFEDRTDHKCNEGEFTLRDGRRFVTYNTAYGDGGYFDEQGREYGVDSGGIGCIKLLDIDLASGSNYIDGGHIIDFPREFETAYQDGKIIIGHIVIDTDPDYEDEYDYEN
jgi:hypothetical protein